MVLFCVLAGMWSSLQQWKLEQQGMGSWDPTQGVSFLGGRCFVGRIFAWMFSFKCCPKADDKPQVSFGKWKNCPLILFFSSHLSLSLIKWILTHVSTSAPFTFSHVELSEEAWVPHPTHPTESFCHTGQDFEWGKDFGTEILLFLH